MVRFYSVLVLVSFPLLLIGPASSGEESAAEAAAAAGAGQLVRDGDAGPVRRRADSPTEAGATGGTPQPAPTHPIDDSRLRRLERSRSTGGSEGGDPQPSVGTDPSREPRASRRSRETEVERGADSRNAPQQPGDPALRRQLEELGYSGRNSATPEPPIQTPTRTDPTEASGARSQRRSQDAARAGEKDRTQRQPNAAAARKRRGGQGAAPAARRGRTPQQASHPDSSEEARLRERIEAETAARALGIGDPDPAETIRTYQVIETQGTGRPPARSRAQQPPGQPGTSDTGSRMQELLEAERAKSGTR